VVFPVLIITAIVVVAYFFGLPKHHRSVEMADIVPFLNHRLI